MGAREKRRRHAHGLVLVLFPKRTNGIMTREEGHYAEKKMIVGRRIRHGRSASIGNDLKIED